MARRKFESPQKKNPHALPVRQHVFPAASIARFADNSGVVSLCRLSTGKVLKAKPSNPIFCAMRAWDMRAEVGYMKQIEDEFQEFASRIIDGSVRRVEAADKRKADQFFALWKMRAIFRDKELDDVPFTGITGKNFNQDQEEICEKKGVLFVREGGVMSAHRVHGVQIQVGVIHETSALSKVQWGIVRAHEGQFVVPDFPAVNFIPLEPTLALCGAIGDVIDNAVILKTNVASINRHLQATSREYYFANDLRQCF